MKAIRPTGRLFVIALAAVGILLFETCGGAQPVVEAPPPPTRTSSSPEPTPTQSPAAFPTPTPSPTPAAPAEPVEFQIDSTDGSARLSVQITSESLASGDGITLTEVAPTDWPEEMAGLEPVGPVYEISAPDVELDEPAVVSITFNPAALARAGIDPAEGMGALLLVSRSDDGQWELLANPETQINLTTGRVVVSAAATHFSKVFARKTDRNLQLRISPTEVIIPVGPEWKVEASVTSISIEDIAVRRGNSTGSRNQIARVLDTFHGEILIPAGQTVRLEPDFTFRCRAEGKDTYRVYIEYRFVRELLSEAATTQRFLAAFGMLDFDDIDSAPALFLSFSGPVECLPFGAETPTPTPTLTPTPFPTPTPGPTRTPRPPEGFIDVEVLHYEGQRFPLEQFHLAEPDTCLLDHFHADFEVYSLEGGSAFDPDRPECGFGTIFDAVITVERVTDAVWADYRNRFAGLDD